MSLVPLPEPINGPWPPSVIDAYTKLNSTYQTASAYVSSSGLESHRLQQYASAIATTAYPLLLLIDESSASNGVPVSWIETAANQFGELLTLLDERWSISEGERSKGVTTPSATYTAVRHHGRGQPRIEIDHSVLENAFKDGRRISKTVLAKVLQIDRKTLQKRLQELDIDTGFSSISDSELDAHVRQYLQENPTGGRSYVIGWLRSRHGLRIQRSRAIMSMIRVDQLGHGMKQARGKKKPRQKYSVPRPNALWHIDGHHKLIQWGIVIHGVVDGYSRKVTGLRASNDNSAETVLAMFISAIAEHGVPSRVRGDRGGENRDVAILMILLRGLHRASFMWGPSVFNTRIERLWVELGERFVRQWRAFFMRLESQHLLQRKNAAHRWLLHYLFLDAINDDCDKFCNEWNAKRISGAGGRSPNELAYLGELQHGYYDDECRGLTEDEIYQFYGFKRSYSAAESDGESDSDEEIDEFDTEEIIDSNIRHEAVPVPLSNSPLSAGAMHLFTDGLQLLEDSGDIPEGYGASIDELGPDGFDEHEDIVIGIRRQAYSITLPRSIWEPRMCRWAQGLFVLDLHTLLSSTLLPSVDFPCASTHSMRRSRPAPKARAASRSKKPSKGIKTQPSPDNGDNGSSSEGPTSPNPRPRKAQKTGLSRLEDLLGSSDILKASKEATTGRTRSSARAASTVKRSTGKAKDEVFVVDTVLVVPYGVIANPDVNDASALAFVPVYKLATETVNLTVGAMAGYKQCGLCQIDHHEGFVFRRSDTHLDVNETLRQALPLLFSYLDALNEDSSSQASDDAHLSHWLICVPAKYRSNVEFGHLDVYSDDTHPPTGTDIIDAINLVSSKAKAVAKSRVLYLTTRDPIPEHILKSWRPQPRATSSRVTSSKAIVMRDASDDDHSDGSSLGSTKDSSSSESESEGTGFAAKAKAKRVMNDVISVSSGDETSKPAVRVTRSMRAATEPADDLDADAAFLASFDFLNDAENPHL